LREEERTAISLFYIEDLSHKSIAAVMNCPEGTVKSYIIRGLAKLEKYLTNVGYGRKD
jgi:RNA polymerase sigma-70 factor (ECF subfamily)